jgi:hypothetical protein
VKRPRKLPTDRARRFCSALGDLSENRQQRWRMMNSVVEKLGLGWDEAEAAAREAEAQGWLLVEDGHSVCLTDAGRRLASPTLRRS